MNFFSKKKDIYEFMYESMHESHVKKRPIEYQKKGWEVASVGGAFRSGSGEYVPFVFKRKINK